MQQNMNNDGGSVHLAECVMYDNKYSIPFLDIYFLLGPYYPSECIVRSIKKYSLDTKYCLGLFLGEIQKKTFKIKGTPSFLRGNGNF